MKDLVPCEVIRGDQLWEAKVVGPKLGNARVVIFMGDRRSAEYICKALNAYKPKKEKNKHDNT